MLNFFAETAAGSDTMISGDWLIGVIGALATGAAALVGKLRVNHVRRQSQEITVKPPVPTVTVRQAAEYVSRAEFEGLKQDIDGQFTEIKDVLTKERDVARVAIGNVHKRIDAMSENIGGKLGVLEGIVKGMSDTSSKLLDIALKNSKFPR